MYLIIGLGNPEKDYANTRHNMGFNVINKLSERFGIDVNKNKFKGLYGSGNVDGEKVFLFNYLRWKFNILMQTANIRAKRTAKATKIAAVGPIKFKSYPKWFCT